MFLLSLKCKARIIALGFWLGLACLILLSNAAFAQGAAAPSAAPQISADDFAMMINGMKGAARSMSPYLIDEGVGLAGALFTFSFFVTLALLIVAFHPSHKANLIVLFFKAMVVLTMLASWVDYGPGPNGETVTPTGAWTTQLTQYHLPYSVENVLVNSFDDLAGGVFATWGGGGGKERVFNVVGQSWSMMWNASAKRGELRDQARAAITNPLTRIASYFDSIGDMVVTLLVALIVGLLALALMAVYLFVIYLGDITAALGMFMGPLMVPGILFKRTEFLFDTWLKYMIYAGFYKLIAAWVAILTMKSVEQIQVIANDMYAKAVASAVAGATGPVVANGVLMDAAFLLSIAMTIIYMSFGIFMMLNVPKLTNQLMNGSSGGFAGTAAQAAEGGSKATKQVANATRSMASAIQRLASRGRE